MRVLVTGANGLLGPYLVDAFKEKNTVVVTTRQEYDLTNRAMVKSLLSPGFEVVIHAAAQTNIEYCEAEPIQALAANRDTTYHLVELLPSSTKLVYISTDMVYPDIRGPHRESDVGPINVYGRSKLAGEKAAAVNPRHLILRTNFFGPRIDPTPVSRRSLSDWVIQSLQDGTTPIYYNDIWFTPLHMKTLSAIILELVERDLIGVYNLGARTAMSKAQFAQSIAEHKGLIDHFKSKCVGPAHFHTRRPRDTSLDCEKLLAMGVRLPTLEEEIQKL